MHEDAEFISTTYSSQLLDGFIQCLFGDTNDHCIIICNYFPVTFAEDWTDSRPLSTEKSIENIKRDYVVKASRQSGSSILNEKKKKEKPSVHFCFCISHLQPRERWLAEYSICYFFGTTSSRIGNYLLQALRLEKEYFSYKELGGEEKAQRLGQLAKGIQWQLRTRYA